jgi:predicted PurR-regulated permease PerM
MTLRSEATFLPAAARPMVGAVRVRCATARGRHRPPATVRHHSGPTLYSVSVTDDGGLILQRAPRARLAWLALAVLVLLWLAKDVLPPFVIAAVVAYAFSPLVGALEERSRLPRVVVVLVLYAVALAAIAIAAWAVSGQLISELEELATGGPAALADTLRGLLGHDAIQIGTRQITVEEIARQLNNAIGQALATPTDALHFATLVGEAAVQAVLVLIVAFYLLLDGQRFWTFALGFLQPVQRERASGVAGRIHLVLGRWLRGQLGLIVLVALVLYFSLGPVLHVPYALALALLSGVLEIIPLVGPIIAAALAGTVAFSHGGTDITLVVLAVYLVVREVEDQLVMPLVIGRAVHLHPVVTIFAVLVGLSVWGILGGLLAVPVAAALNVTLTELYPTAATADAGPRTGASATAVPRSGTVLVRPDTPRAVPDDARPTADARPPGAHLE